MSFIDLHVHSTASDGSCTPEELVEMAIEKKLSAIAITDHDTLEGVGRAKRAAKGSSLEIISGVEISCDYKEKEIHILGLLLDENNEALNVSLRTAREKREKRNKEMIKKFQEAGIPMTEEGLNKGKANTVITRAHFAKYLMENGYVAVQDEAFKKYLSKKSHFYVQRSYIEPEHAIELIKNAGGSSFLAHPYLYRMSDKEIDEMIQTLVQYGLDGIEVYHSSHNLDDIQKLRKFATKYHLLVSGGSDFHGSNKAAIDLSVGRGNLRLTHFILEDIIAAREKKEKSNT